MTTRQIIVVTTVGVGFILLVLELLELALHHHRVLGAAGDEHRRKQPSRPRETTHANVLLEKLQDGDRPTSPRPQIRSTWKRQVPPRGAQLPANAGFPRRDYQGKRAGS